MPAWQHFFGSLGTHRLFLKGKNKISIFNPCENSICALLWRLLCLLLLTYISAQLLQLQHFQQELLKRQHHELLSKATPRIFCVIITYGYRHNTCAVNMKRTWVNHCDRYIFVSDDQHGELEPAVFPQLPDKWQRIRAQMLYVYKYHFDEGDWFVYANDDNFVVIENLREMLQSYNYNESIYFGCKMRSETGQTFMFHRSTMVLSRAAVESFVLEALPDESICSAENQGSNEKAAEEFGRCLNNINVTAGDTRNELGQHTFLPFEMDLHLGGSFNISREYHEYFLNYTYYEVNGPRIPVSKRFISCHVEYLPIAMDLYYSIYKTNIFGLPLPKETVNK